MLKCLWVHREGLGPSRSPSRAWDRSCSGTAGHPYCGAVTAQWPQMEGKVREKLVFCWWAAEDGAVQGVLQQIWGPNRNLAGPTAELQEGLCPWSCTEISRDAGGKAWVSLCSRSRVLRIRHRSWPWLLAIPPVRPPGCELLGAPAGTQWWWVLFCLNEFICGRLDSRGLRILETSTWGTHPWRSVRQPVAGREKKKGAERSVISAALLVPFAVGAGLVQAGEEKAERGP